MQTAKIYIQRHGVRQEKFLNQRRGDGIEFLPFIFVYGIKGQWFALCGKTLSFFIWMALIA